MTPIDRFEKLAALIFLFILVGLIMFMVWVPMPSSSEKVVLMLVGSLLAASIGALPKLFGTSNTREKELEVKNEELEFRVRLIEAKYEALETQYAKLTDVLIGRHLYEEQK